MLQISSMKNEDNSAMAASSQPNKQDKCINLKYESSQRGNLKAKVNMMETKSDKTGKVCSLPCSSCHIGQ
jgi:hypothetical protein